SAHPIAPREQLMLAVLRDLLCRFCHQSADLAPMLLSFDRVAGQGKARGIRCTWQRMMVCPAVAPQVASVPSNATFRCLLARTLEPLRTPPATVARCAR